MATTLTRRIETSSETEADWSTQGVYTTKVPSVASVEPVAITHEFDGSSDEASNERKNALRKLLEDLKLLSPED